LLFVPPINDHWRAADKMQAETVASNGVVCDELWRASTAGRRSKTHRTGDAAKIEKTNIERADEGKYWTVENRAVTLPGQSTPLG